MRVYGLRQETLGCTQVLIVGSLYWVPDQGAFPQLPGVGVADQTRPFNRGFGRRVNLPSAAGPCGLHRGPAAVTGSARRARRSVEVERHVTLRPRHRYGLVGGAPTALRGVELARAHA